LLQLGINVPNLSVNLGVTINASLSSYVTTIGELGVYKTMIDNMSDMLDQMSLFTTKFQFNYLSHRLHVLTGIDKNIMLEVYANIPQRIYTQIIIF
jgi:hypothetical protein